METRSLGFTALIALGLAGVVSLVEWQMHDHQRRIESLERRPANQELLDPPGAEPWAVEPLESRVQTLEQDLARLRRHLEGEPPPDFGPPVP